MRTLTRLIAAIEQAAEEGAETLPEEESGNITITAAHRRKSWEICEKLGIKGGEYAAPFFTWFFATMLASGNFSAQVLLKEYAPMKSLIKSFVKQSEKFGKAQFKN